MPSECCGIWLESAASCTSLGIKHLSALSAETTHVYLHADMQIKKPGDGSDKAGGSAQGSLPARRRAVGVPQLPLTCFMPTIRPVRPVRQRLGSHCRHKTVSGICPAMPIIGIIVPSATCAWPRSSRKSRMLPHPQVRRSLLPYLKLSAVHGESGLQPLVAIQIALAGCAVDNMGE